jgi:glyoxylate reductase
MESNKVAPEALKNTMSKILVTWPFPSSQLAPLLEAGHDVRIHCEERAMSRSELHDGVADAEALVSVLFDPVDQALLDAAPQLRVVSNVAVGVDNIDLEACASRGVTVTHTPGVLTDATADLAIGLILACARRVVEGDRLVRSGQWVGWRPNQLLGLELRGALLGIVGAGRIGRATARRARAFGMEIAYCSRSGVPELEAELGARRMDLQELVETADVVSVHVPLSAETRHLLGGRHFAAMKPGSILVNTARGPVLDEVALVKALEKGRPGFAGLDVYEGEPGLTAGLGGLPNVVLLPHLGSATHGTRAEMVRLAVEGALAVLDSRKPEHAILPPRTGD